MKKLIFYFVLTIAFIVLVGYFSQGKIPLGQNTPLPSSILNKNNLETKEISLAGKTIKVMIADTQEKRAKGLSVIDDMNENEGMLFVFDKTEVSQPFWMKGMKFGIDIIWIKDGKVSQITKDVPAPNAGTPESKLKLYLPDNPIDHVLEVKAGYAEKNNIKVGDEVNNL